MALGKMGPRRAAVNGGGGGALKKPAETLIFALAVRVLHAHDRVFPRWSPGAIRHIQLGRGPRSCSPRRR